LSLADKDLQNIHKIPLQQLFETLGSSHNGLTEEESQNRLRAYGPNKLSEKKEKPLIVKFILQFNNFFSYLLLLGALLSFISESIQPGQGSIYVGFALVGVTVLNAIFTFVQEQKAEKAMKEFKKLMTSKVVVMRNGRKQQIDSTCLVPGDVMLLSEGEKITADARLFSMSNLKVNHSALTGESEPLLRSIEPTSNKILLSRNMVLSGTLVQSGTGEALVVSTGDNTQIGKIATATRSIDVQVSHIHKQIRYFIKIISYIAIVLGITFFCLGVFIVQNPFWANIVFAIGIIVANVPEGLLPTVTLALSIASQRMARQKVLVKNIDSIETLGSVTIICSDKTGTLTENNNYVHGFFLNGKFYSYDHNKKQIFLEKTLVDFPSIQGILDFQDILLLCNNSTYNPKTKTSFGDSLEICLKSFVSSFQSTEDIEKKHRRTQEIPFTSETKYMITANTYDTQQRAFLKGAPEVVVRKCSSIFLDGKQVPFTDSYKDEILHKNEEYAQHGFRLLGAGHKDISSNGTDELEKPDYCFYGLVIMQDPPRKEVPEAVRLCHNAGIKIFIISGDQEKTVENIARQIGIITSQPTIINGEELDSYDDDTLKKILQGKEVIFARTLPKDKLRIVSALKDLGEIVAVTGDGVNDAPALRKADVGIAMGASGTEVAKEASDIILLDDNFASIVQAIKSGRTVYENIKRFILYILTSNTPEIVPFLFFVVFGWPLALPVLLILCIDLGTDMFPAIALGMEPSPPDIMEQQPRDPKKKILNWKMIARSYGFIGPLQTMFSYIVFFSILFNGGWTFGRTLGITDPLYLSAVTGFFGTVVVTQIFNVFACRTSRVSVFAKGLFSNKFILIGISIEVLLLLLISYVPGLQLVLSTAPFPLYFFPWMIGFGLIILLSEELRKYLFRRFGIFGLE
jgi:sodium/potassium-transporting ATPase subunit alpha